MIGQSSEKGSTDGYKIPKHTHFAEWDSGTSWAWYCKKSPTSCLLGSYPFLKRCAVCCWQRPDAGLDAFLTKHLFPSSTKIWALHCTTFTECILFTCFAHTVHASLYELFIKPSEKWTNASDCKTRKIHCVPFYKVRTTVHELWPQRNSIQNSNSMAIFFSPI